jgi:hypothetical protein
MRAAATGNRFFALVLIIGLVCIGVLMQMLGTTMTMWDLSYQLDPDNAPLLDGFSLPATFVDIGHHFALRWKIDTVKALHPVLRDQALFRPPNHLA